MIPFIPQELETVQELNGCSDMNYMVLDDVTRNIDYGGGNYCDKAGRWESPDWHGSGWYRMKEPAGTRMPESDPGGDHCGTSASIWFNGTHPTAIGETIQGISCASHFRGSCYAREFIKIKNCGSFYLYYLPNSGTGSSDAHPSPTDGSGCTRRYCSTTTPATTMAPAKTMTPATTMNPATTKSSTVTKRH